MPCIIFHNPFNKFRNVVCAVQETTNIPIRAQTDMPRSEQYTDFSIAPASRSRSVPSSAVCVASLGDAPPILSAFAYHDELRTNIDVSEKGPSQKIKIPRSNTSDKAFAKKYIESRKEASIKTFY